MRAAIVWLGARLHPSLSCCLRALANVDQVSSCLHLMPTQGRVLVADSWFGSVACVLELFRHTVFCIMNVKTGTKGFPKAELMAV
eukprot:206994-Pleurochrysis_carterae.AAC.1